MKKKSILILAIVMTMLMSGCSGTGAKVSVSSKNPQSNQSNMESTISSSNTDEDKQTESEQVETVAENNTSSTPAETNVNTPKTVAVSPVDNKNIDNSEKVTMIDINTYFNNTKMTAKPPVFTAPQRIELTGEMADASEKLVNAINSNENEFTYTFTSYPENFASKVENNVYVKDVNYSSNALIVFSCRLQRDKTYLFTCNLVSTRNNINAYNNNFNEWKNKQMSSYNSIKSIYDNKANETVLLKRQIANAVSEAGIVKGMPVRTALEKINEYIKKCASYDYEVCNKINKGEALTADRNGTYRMFFTHGKMVCNGYATMTTLMARYCGIKCWTVVSEKQNHGWNYVEFDNQGLYTDTTWNDTQNNNKYLLITKEEIGKDHILSDNVLQDGICW